MEQQYPAWLDDPYINFSNILSYNCAINFLDTPRERGKTWGIQIRALKHAIRTGHSTILVRRTRKSTNAAKAKVFNPKICHFLGISPDDIIRQGDMIFYKQGDKKRIPILEFYALTERERARSSDSGVADLFCIDEANIPPAEMSYFRGDPVENALDIWQSVRRGGHMPMLIFGNRESVINPFQSYFGIQPLPIDFNGIKRFRQKSILVAQSTKKTSNRSDFSDSVDMALRGTRYQSFADSNHPRGVDEVHIRRTKPAKSVYYCTFYIREKWASAWRYDGGLWIGDDAMDTRCIYVINSTPPEGRKVEILKKLDDRFRYMKKSHVSNSIFFKNHTLQELFLTEVFK